MTEKQDEKMHGVSCLCKDCKPQAETCENCGHDVFWHYPKKGKCHGREKSCKKFKAQKKGQKAIVNDGKRLLMKAKNHTLTSGASDPTGLLPEDTPSGVSEPEGTFNLSKKIAKIVKGGIFKDKPVPSLWIEARDVKEFIRRLKRIVKNNTSIRYEKRKHFCEKIDKLAGEELSK